MCFNWESKGEQNHQPLISSNSSTVGSWAARAFLSANQTIARVNVWVLQSVTIVKVKVITLAYAKIFPIVPSVMEMGMVVVNGQNASRIKEPLSLKGEVNQRSNLTRKPCAWEIYPTERRAKSKTHTHVLRSPLEQEPGVPDDAMDQPSLSQLIT